MGIFYVDCDIVNVQHAKKKVSVSKLLVDTGAELTWIPEGALQQAGIGVVKKDVPFLMANGQSITRSIGYAIIRVAGFQTVDEVVFGQPGDLSLLGSRTLEGFGAMVDPRKKKLVAAGPHPAACASWRGEQTGQAGRGRRATLRRHG
jgi:predicted aspartyl protease